MSRDTSRQERLAPTEALKTSATVVIGVGAIGRQVACQLAAIGPDRVTIIDPDTVGEENLPNQGYWPSNLLGKKVTATADLMAKINPGLRVYGEPRRYRREDARQLSARSAVFCCVDTMSARKLIWESLQEFSGLFVDTRAHGETIRILAANTSDTWGHYATTLFPDSEAYSDGHCAAPSTIYTSNLAAALALNQFTRWLRGLPVNADTLLNLAALEIYDLSQRQDRGAVA